MAQIEVFPGVEQSNDGEEVLSGQHYWHLKASNGEIVAQSEGYTSQDHALEGAAALLRAAAECLTVTTTLSPKEGSVLIHEDEAEVSEEGS